MPIQVAKVREFKGHTQAIYTLCLAGYPASFYSAGADGMVVKWTMENEDGELLIKLNHPVYSLFFRNNLLFCGGNNGSVTIIDCMTKAVIKILAIHHAAVFDIQYFENNILLAHENGCFSIIDINFSLIHDIAISSKSLRKILVCGNEIYLSGSEGVIWKLNGEFGIIRQKTAESLSIFALAFHQEKKILLSGGRNATLKLWDNFEEIKSINAHWYSIKDIAFNESQQYFATCSMDKSIKLWSAGNFELVKVIDIEKLKGHQSSVNKILWIGINRFISCSDDRTIMCFDFLD